MKNWSHILFLSHSQKYLPNSKITQNLLFLVFFFLIFVIYLFIDLEYLFIFIEYLKKYSINWCHAIIVRLATAPTTLLQFVRLFQDMPLDLATAIDVSFVLFASFVVLWLVVIVCTRQPLKDIKTTVERTPSRVLRSDTTRHHFYEEKNPVKLLWIASYHVSKAC